jgi:UDP-glucuronate 4-epimerase
MKINTVLVTGGSGFIGSNLIDNLIQQNNRIICIDNFDDFYSKSIKLSNMQASLKSPLYTFIEGDIRNKELLEKIFQQHPIDLVVHLAAKAGVRPSIQDPANYFDVNVNGTLCLINAMNKHNVRKLVFSSSSSVYGNNVKIPYSEGDNVDFPISPYAASKKSCELLIHTFHHLNKLDVINLRFFTVYGPRQRPDLAINKFFKNIYAGQPIDVYGDGSTSRDYTFIEDIVQGIVHSINYLAQHEDVYETINLGNNQPVKLIDLIASIEEVTSRKFLIKHLPPQEGDVDHTYADIAKARKILSYNPTKTIKEGLLKFNEWYEGHKS